MGKIVRTIRTSMTGMRREAKASCTMAAIPYDTVGCKPLPSPHARTWGEGSGKHNKHNDMDTQQSIEPFTAKVVSIFGYDGLPERFMVESKHGWLNEDGFGSMSRAYIFQSRKSASEKLEKLYPQAIEVTP